MSSGLLMLLIILGGMLCAIAYFAYGFYKDHKADILHIRECRAHYHKGDALCIDYWRMDGPFGLDRHRRWMEVTRSWVPKGDNPEEIYEGIYRAGYLSAEKWMTKLRYYGIPVFVKLHNFKIIDPRTMDEARIGYPQNKITSTILYNTYKARTVKKWKDALSKVSFAEMDLKGLGIFLPLIIGLAIGVAYFMLGGF